MDSTSILVYLAQMGLVGGWFALLLYGFLLISTGLFIACIIIGIWDEYRHKDVPESEIPEIIV